ncbi:histidine phosphatase family protein [Georgenia sp. Z1491]|uniref:histidine phosphatase family protein n=1 Tax=Georgenia sp. Z1491 TaxID=3416707 RepID=UPI003CF5F363
MPHTVVHLLRHGEVHNPSGVLYGRLPGYHLSERGRAMARAVAAHLSETGHDVRRVVASPLERAQETGRPVAEAFGVEVETDERLIEGGNALEGTAIRADPLALAHPRHWPLYVDPFRPSWGEAYRAIADRTTDAVRSVLARSEGGEVVLVSHQLPIWITRLVVERRPLAHDPRRRECALASLTSLHFDDRRLVGITYDEPAAALVADASDVTPGTSRAAVNTGSARRSVRSGTRTSPPLPRAVPTPETADSAADAGEQARA